MAGDFDDIINQVLDEQAVPPGKTMEEVGIIPFGVAGGRITKANDNMVGGGGGGGATSKYRDMVSNAWNRLTAGRQPPPPPPQRFPGPPADRYGIEGVPSIWTRPGYLDKADVWNSRVGYPPMNQNRRGPRGFAPEE